MHDHIEVVNARVHNLKNVTLEIPREKLVVFTGVSGSGKSSLVFDTLHTEAQRQLVETFSSFARRRLPKLSRPHVDDIRNLSTSIVIDQKRLGRTLRSTVGTATEVYTYLRMLYARCGSMPGIPSFLLGFNHPDGMCPACAGLGKRIRVNTEMLIDPTLTLRQGAITHPDWKVGAWNWRELTAISLFDIDMPVGEFSAEELERLLHADDIPIEKPHGGGTYAKAWRGVARRLEQAYVDKAEDELPEAKRDVYQRYFTYGACDVCGGLRLNPRALAITVDGVGVGDAVQMELADLDAWLATIHDPVADPLVTKMRGILSHLIEIGVGYLSLNRSVATLSGGESQRVKMARQLDCDLIGMMYILDEPSIGLHPRDIAKLVEMLRLLRDKGNSVLVVEHDASVICAADHVVEIGPTAGSGGGEVCFEGPLEEFLGSESRTAVMMRSGARIAARDRRDIREVWQVRGARANNLKDVNVDIPKNALVAVTGVAGSGKSSLIHDEFAISRPDAIVVDQGAIGRSSRSNPATYLGFFDTIRKLFAEETGRPAALFSFNSKGACPTCKGQGRISVEMSFLDDVKVKCSECHGRRYTDEVLALTWRDLSIHDVLSLTAREALELFEHKAIHATLALLCEVGLEYLTLGQPLSTLSGGECQRIKLVTELGKSGNLYVLDEPTTGLHMADIERLMAILNRLVDGGNSVVVIEHNLDVIAQADWVIDLGPEGGSAGGRIVAVGTPEMIAGERGSHTGRFLAERLRAV
ncbi:MAG TPA: excinuclease ABC subunit UvrA [Coriobacteriia bacterium]